MILLDKVSVRIDNRFYKTLCIECILATPLNG
jgi:hypothetical protein